MNNDRDQLVKLLTSSKVPNAIPADAIVIIDGVRTPLTKAKRGGLRDYKADDLLSVVLKVFAETTMILQYEGKELRIHKMTEEYFLLSFRSY